MLLTTMFLMQTRLVHSVNIISNVRANVVKIKLYRVNYNKVYGYKSQIGQRSNNNNNVPKMDRL